MKFVNANYIPYTPDNYLSYDNVLLIPQYSTVKSRNDPKMNLSARATANFSDLTIPIVSAPMSTVTESAMAIAVNKAGGLGILHRFYKTNDEYLAEIIKVHTETGKVAFSVGLDNDWINFIGSVIARVGFATVCVDVAHGHLRDALEQVYKISTTFRNKVDIIGGSVCTPEAVRHLIKSGATGIRVGVGCGSLCTTRLVTGFGVSQLTAIIHARAAINGEKSNAKIIADGGIRHSGDIVKALAAGADCVMVGNLLAGTDESPGEIQENDLGKKYKIYYGQASKDAMNLINKINIAPEGETMKIPYKGPVKEILDNLVGGIKSGLSYNGVYNIDDLYEKAIFIEVSSATHIESQPHGLYSSL